MGLEVILALLLGGIGIAIKGGLEDNAIAEKYARRIQGSGRRDPEETKRLLTPSPVPRSVVDPGKARSIGKL